MFVDVLLVVFPNLIFLGYDLMDEIESGLLSLGDRADVVALCRND